MALAIDLREFSSVHSRAQKKKKNKAMNSSWTKAKDVRVLEVWTEMTRVHISCARVPANNTKTNARATKVLKNERT